MSRAPKFIYMATPAGLGYRCAICAGRYTRDWQEHLKDPEHLCWEIARMGQAVDPTQWSTNQGMHGGHVV